MSLVSYLSFLTNPHWQMSSTLYLQLCLPAKLPGPYYSLLGLVSVGCGKKPELPSFHVCSCFSLHFGYDVFLFWLNILWYRWTHVYGQCLTHAAPFSWYSHKYFQRVKSYPFWKIQLSDGNIPNLPLHVYRVSNFQSKFTSIEFI